MQKKILLTCVALCALASGTASAAQFDFYKLGNNGEGPNFLPTDGVPSTGGDLSSSDVDNGVLNDDLTFISGGITVKATGTHNGNVVASVQDHEDNWKEHTTGGTKAAGLGVYHTDPVQGSDDNITLGEVLTLTFDRLVTITSLEVRAEGHNVNWEDGTTFLFRGVETTLPQGDGEVSVNETGTSFTFAYGGADPDQFYIAAVTANEVRAPDTASAMALFGLGLASLAMGRRRLA